MLLYIMSAKEAMGDLLRGGEEHKEQMGGIKAGVDVGASVLGGRRRRRSSKRKARKSRKSRRKSRKARRRRSRRH